MGSCSTGAWEILLTAYPQVRKRLNLDALNLGFFEPGARVRAGGRFHVLSDPLRRPWQLPATLCSPAGNSLTDKLRTAALVAGVVTLSAPKLLRRTETTTASRLRRARAVAGVRCPVLAAAFRRHPARPRPGRLVAAF